MDTIYLILFCIAIAFWWHAIMKEQRRLYGYYDEIEENLTMEENPIIITIENYCGQRVTFTMSPEAEIESTLCIIGDKVTEVHINAFDSDILIEKEDI